MSVHTYKCSNCGGGLIFNPETQDFVCEFCQSHFSKEQLEAGTNGFPKEETEATIEEQSERKFYSCPRCGAEVDTDATTAATYCYYCHNPVVLSDRLTGEFEPDSVIPFSIEKDEATEKMLNWIGGKWFIPKNFYSKKQIEKVTGIYFPNWFVDCQAQGDLSARATRVRTWQDSRFRYTETQFYDVRRSGNISIYDIPKKALNKEESKLYEAVLPFDTKKAEEFTAAYLSGFQAEKRNIEAKELESETAEEVKGYTQTILSDTINGYTTVTPSSCSVRNLDTEWKYTLLPVWVMTYQDRSKKIYYYAMNGQSGKVNGELPIDHRKLGLLSAGISAILCVLLLLGGYFLL